MANKTVLNQLSQRTGVDQQGNPTYISYPVGSEARYVGAQRHSHANNLEEQLIIGTDYQDSHTYSTDSTTGNIQEVETINFKKNDSQGETDYYQLTKTVTRRPSTAVDAANKKLTLNFNPSVVSEEEELSFYSSQSNSSVPVSRKEVTYTYSGSDFNEAARITNRLS